MFVEGCYLHTAIVMTYSTDKLRKWVFLFIGWCKWPLWLKWCSVVPGIKVLKTKRGKSKRYKSPWGEIWTTQSEQTLLSEELAWKRASWSAKSALQLLRGLFLENSLYKAKRHTSSLCCPWGCSKTQLWQSCLWDAVVSYGFWGQRGMWKNWRSSSWKRDQGFKGHELWCEAEEAELL